MKSELHQKKAECVFSHSSEKTKHPFYLHAEAAALYIALENTNFALTNSITSGSLCFGV